LTSWQDSEGFRILSRSSALVVTTTSKVFRMNIQFCLTRAYVLDGDVRFRDRVLLRNRQVQREHCVAVVRHVEVVEVVELVR